jgi:hypothetical protein
MELAFFLDLFRRRRKKARAAIRAMPMMGPTTAPAIQAFDFFFFLPPELPPELGDDDGVGVSVITTPGDGAVVATLTISRCEEVERGMAYIAPIVSPWPWQALCDNSSS